MKRLVLIDSNALVHRAFHALPPLTSPSGEPTNAIYGFTTVLLKMIGELKPDYIVAAFDLAGPTFRHTEYDQYKAHRVKAPDELYAQIPGVKRLLTALGIPIFEAAGFEADDVIGTISQQSRQVPDLQTVIVTGDLDTLQLVHGQQVVVFTLRKGMSDTITYDEAGVRERFGLTPAQVPDFKGLKGDPSDNIPGVKGIGDKTASALIAEFGSVETLYEELNKPAFADTAKSRGVSEKLREKLLADADAALFSKHLATIVRDVPITFDLAAADWRTHCDLGMVESLCLEFGFTSLIKRVRDAVGGAAQPELAPAPAATILSEEHVTVVSRASELPESAQASVWLATDSTGESQLTVSPDGVRLYRFLAPEPALLGDVLASYPHIIGFQLHELFTQLPDPAAIHSTLFDTAIASWLINPEQRDYSWTRVAPLGTTTHPALALWKLHDSLNAALATAGMTSLATDIEMPLIPILAAMQQRGILVDRARIAELSTRAAQEVGELERSIYSLAGTPFNINSPAQLAEILYDRLGITGRIRRTAGGARSTAAPELEKLRESNPIIDKILEYRELSKLTSTYIEPFPSLIAADGRVHTTYNHTGTATGRLSSSNPNLQNIPARTELGQEFRAAFVAAPGTQLLSLDYSQVELRIVAHIAKDSTMIEAFRAGEDIHTRTASEVFGVAPIQVTKDMRRQAKVLNFGIIYGMGTLGFARAASVSRDAARTFIDEYFTRFSGVAAYMERTKQEAFQNGFTTTLLGRRRLLPDITSRMPQLAAQSERMAINHPIQGTAADLIKLAMIAVEKHIIAADLTRDVRMLLQVHDELVFEVRTELVASVAQQLTDIMEHVLTLTVPIIVDAKCGSSWSAMTPLTHL